MDVFILLLPSSLPSSRSSIKAAEGEGDMEAGPGVPRDFTPQCVRALGVPAGPSLSSAQPATPAPCRNSRGAVSPSHLLST